MQPISSLSKSERSRATKLGYAPVLSIMWLAGCASPAPGPVEFEVTAERAGRASCGAPYDDCAPLDPTAANFCERTRELAETAADSVIAIDPRGRYSPLVFSFGSDCAQQAPVRQLGPGQGCDAEQNGPLAERYTDCFVELAKRIRGRIVSPPAGQRYHLLVFVHGGLNTEENRLERGFVDANRMFADPEGAGAATGGEARETWYPLFVTWPSGGIQSYVDQRVHYNQGDYDSDFKRASSPLYFLTDAVESVVRAPVAWAESISWLAAGPNERVANQIGCADLSPLYRCAPLKGADDRSSFDEFLYWNPVGLAGRIVTVPVVDAVGQPTWDAMVSRTRMLMRKPFDDEDFAAANGKLDGKSDLWYLFNVLRELPPDERPPITLIGHSMGAIVINEILTNFPDLPYRSIVFMGGAASVRDTLASLSYVTAAGPQRELTFYNLSLHQDAEAGEVGYAGTVSKGSLLEWVDRMYTTPATFADRTVGKWVNAVMASGDFLALQPRLQMEFKRFGLSCTDPLKHGEFDEYEPRPDCAPRTPYWRPAFWTVPEGPPGG